VTLTSIQVRSRGLDKSTNLTVDIRRLQITGAVLNSNDSGSIREIFQSLADHLDAFFVLTDDFSALLNGTRKLPLNTHFGK
jgi:hypothetical protein